MTALDRLDAIDARARVNPSLVDVINHGGDCAGSLCGGCGHCLHSIDVCDHDCDGSGGGCSTAFPDPEIDFRRDVTQATAALRAVLNLCDAAAHPLYGSGVLSVTQTRRAVESALAVPE